MTPASPQAILPAQRERGPREGVPREGAPREGVPREGAWAQSLRLAFGFIAAAVCVLALGWAVSNIRQIPPDSRAVVLRLGSVVRQQGAGLLIAWPPPLERVLLLPAADRQLAFRVSRFDAGEESPGAAERAAEIGPAETSGLPIDPDPRLNTGFLLTGDGGVVHLGATLFYQITDPDAYVVQRAHLAPALERAFTAAAVSVVAARDLDAILVARPERAGKGALSTADAGGTGREQLRADLVRAMNRRLAALAEQGAGFGVSVSRVDLTASLPGNAKAAFDQVLTVTQAAEEMIARARTYAETKSQEAAQQHDRILADARAAAAEQRSLAETRTAAIVALTRNGGAAQGGAKGEPVGEPVRALLDRLYFERIGKLLHRARQVDAVDASGGVRLLLPGELGRGELGRAGK